MSEPKSEITAGIMRSVLDLEVAYDLMLNLSSLSLSLSHHSFILRVKRTKQIIGVVVHESIVYDKTFACLECYQCSSPSPIFPNYYTVDKIIKG